MPRRPRMNLADFTVAQLKAMLAAKTEAEALEVRRGQLQKELNRVEKELAAVMAGAMSGRLRKKTRAKKAAAKRGAKRAGRKVAAKAAKAPRGKRATPTGRATIESVVVDLLKNAGAPMAFKDLLATIKKQKLVKTKSANFANVLRRTLSTSKAVKRAGRGVYRV